MRRCFFAIALCSLPLTARGEGVFSPDERAKIVAYWTTPGRYKIQALPDVKKTGLWQVRLTPEGSLWFWKYQRAIGAGKAPPTQSPTGAAASNAGWKQWVDAKLAYDRWQAQDVADRANGAHRCGQRAHAQYAPPPASGFARNDSR